MDVPCKLRAACLCLSIVVVSQIKQSLWQAPKPSFLRDTERWTWRVKSCSWTVFALRKGKPCNLLAWCPFNTIFFDNCGSLSWWQCGQVKMWHDPEFEDDPGFVPRRHGCPWTVEVTQSGVWIHEIQTRMTFLCWILTDSMIWILEIFSTYLRHIDRRVVLSFPPCIPDPWLNRQNSCSMSSLCIYWAGNTGSLCSVPYSFLNCCLLNSTCIRSSH